MTKKYSAQTVGQAMAGLSIWVGCGVQNLVGLLATLCRFGPRSHSTFFFYMGPLLGSRVLSPSFQDWPHQ